MNINKNFKLAIWGVMTLIVFGIIVIFALRFLPIIPSFVQNGSGGGSGGGGNGIGSGSGSGLGFGTNSTSYKNPPTMPPVQKIPTITNIISAPTSSYRNQANAMVGTVKILNGGGISGADVSLYFTENKKIQGTKVGEGVTDSNGKFTIQVTLSKSFKLGQFQVVAYYYGDNKYDPSNSDPQILVRARTEMELSDTTSSDSKINFNGSLEDDANKPIPKAAIIISVDNAAVVKIITDDNGSFSYQFKTTLGNHYVVASFAGSDVYDKSEKGFDILLTSQKMLPKVMATKSPPSLTPVHKTVEKKSLPWWVYVSIGFVVIILIGGCFWYYQKHRQTSHNDISGVPVSQSNELLLDIQFPKIDFDLPFFWGTIDLPIEVVVIKPKGLKIPLTVNGKEEPMPNKKGEYIFELKYGEQRFAKTVRVIHYSEEIKKDFEALCKKYNIDATELTAREVIGRIKQKEPNHKRLNLLLTLFEKYTYGKKEIIRDEYVDYYRSI